MSRSDKRVMAKPNLVRPRANTVRPYNRREQPLCCSAKFYLISAGTQRAPLRVAIRRCVCQNPTVHGRAWKVSPAGSVGASAYFRMQRSPPETRTPPLRVVIHHWVCAKSNLARADEGIRPLRVAHHRFFCANSEEISLQSSWNSCASFFKSSVPKNSISSVPLPPFSV